MKTKIFIVLLLPISILGQWEQISTIGNYELRGVVFFDASTGLVCGNGGIWRSTNSGMNWLQVWTNDDINAFSFLNSSTGLATGNNGKILKTNNGGLTWSYTITTISENLYAVDFANSTICWAVGEYGRIVKSSNSGTSWYTQTNPQSEDLKAICMYDPLNGYIAGGTTKELFGVTINGGNGWLYPLNQPGFSINAMYGFESLDKIILIGSNGRIRRSTNFGNTWSMINSGTSLSLNSVHFADLVTGYIAGDSGTILKSTNGGISWSSQTSSTVVNLKGIIFIDPNTGWAVGTNGVVLRYGIPVGISSNNEETPETFKLYHNYPNPFNPETEVLFDIAEESFVILTLYDMQGRELKKIYDCDLQKGKHKLRINLGDCSSGVFVFSLICIYKNKVAFRSSLKINLIK